MIGISSRVSGVLTAAVVAAGALVVLTPGTALADPGGGPTTALICNQFTGGPEYTDITDAFTGLIGNSSAAYRVDFTYTDPTTNEPSSFQDYEYWFADADGSYNNDYHVQIRLPHGTQYTWGLTEFSNGSEIDNIITGSGAIGGSSCIPHALKPTEPEFAATTFTPSAAGTFDVPIDVDANTTGSVAVSATGGQLASGPYGSISGTTADAELTLGTADLEYLVRVGSESITLNAESTNSAGTTKGTATGTLEAPPGLQVPTTTITKSPAKKTTSKTATFRFRSSSKHAVFRCSIDGKKAKVCTSPTGYKHLKFGKHRFVVDATDKKSGFRDMTPAAKTWTIKKAKKKH
jgi:hypothetical protein